MQHLACGRIIKTRLGDILRGQSPCSCSRRKAGLTDSEAGNVANQYGYAPQEPYPGAHHPWRCLHLACGNFSSPRLANLRPERATCSCCRKTGFRRDRSAVLYLLAGTGSGKGLRKVGISNVGTPRIRGFAGRGWILLDSVHCLVGADAAEMELRILKMLAPQRPTNPAFQTSCQAAVGALGGSTECFPAGIVPDTLLELMMEVDQHEAQKNNKGAA